MQYCDLDQNNEVSKMWELKSQEKLVKKPHERICWSKWYIKLKDD